MTLIADIEADNLLDKATKIHCISIYDTGTKLMMSYHGDDDLIIGIKRLMNETYRTSGMIVFHNGAGYDLHLVEKLYPDLGLFDLDKVYDTMLGSQMSFPSRVSHSLESWGLDFGHPKVKHEDWTRLSTHMIKRCEGDVEITKKLYELLKSEEHYPHSSMTLETKVLYYHTMQVTHGVVYDVEEASKLFNMITKRKSNIEKQLINEAPWSCSIPGIAKCNMAEVKGNDLLQGCKAFRADGSYNVATMKYFGKDEFKYVKGKYSKVSFSPLNLHSSPDVKDYLLTLGWKPTEWNFAIDPDTGRRRRTSPKLTEDSYASISGNKIGQKIAEYNMLSHRANSIFNIKGPKGALTKVREDGMVEATAITIGTPTARYRHSGVVCNMPRPSSPYGNELRGLIKARPGYKMLGLDLSGIEARMLAHFIEPYEGSAELIALILSDDKSDDFHTHNAKVWGVSRNTAKSALYALTYNY